MAFYMPLWEKKCEKAPLYGQYDVVIAVQVGPDFDFKLMIQKLKWIEIGVEFFFRFEFRFLTFF